MKRFTETTKWTGKPWFRKLPPRLKCLWQLLCDTCDAAGVFEPDWHLFSMQIGEDVAERDLEAFDNRVIQLANGKFWIVKFIAFQYGTLASGCKAHLPAFRSIEKNVLPYGESAQRVSKEYPKGIHTLQEEEKEKNKDKDRKEVQEETNSPPAITAENIVAAYPRRENQTAAIVLVRQHITRGDDAEAMLAGTRAIASVIKELPSGPLNAFVPSAVTFFRDRRWNDDPATWKRGKTGANGEARGTSGGRHGTPLPTPVES